MKNKLLRVNKLSYSVKGIGGKLPILEDISFDLERGRTLGIAGESGSGKTTLGKLLAGILKPAKGEIILDFDSAKRQRTESVQILFQNNGEILNPFRKTREVVEEAVKIKIGKTGANERLFSLFQEINFTPDLWERKGYELSGGEQQRAALARLLAVEPDILILDEPFSAQDPESQLNFLNLFQKIKKDYDITLICIAHNIRLLRKLCDEIIIIYKGRIVEKGETGNIFDSPAHPYTKFLLKSENYNLSFSDFKATF
jgi:ABC-type dipeptide/oligopeptide/nickel transport system ATPase subunit